MIGIITNSPSTPILLAKFSETLVGNFPHPSHRCRLSFIISVRSCALVAQSSFDFCGIPLSFPHSLLSKMRPVYIIPTLKSSIMERQMEILEYATNTFAFVTSASHILRETQF